MTCHAYCCVRMNEVRTGNMLSFVANTLCCEVRETAIGRMPRVVPDQRAKYENDEIFRKLGRECEVSDIRSKHPEVYDSRV